MSLETWEAEFYPIPAKDVPKDKALAHSLQKWIGLRPENLAKHGVVLSGNWLYEKGNVLGGGLQINSSSCALCLHYFNMKEVLPCLTCSLSIARGNVACDRIKSGESKSPWRRFAQSGEVEPMIKALTEANDESKATAVPE